jgi:hypothetical protein
VCGGITKDVVHNPASFDACNDMFNKDTDTGNHRILGFFFRTEFLISGLFLRLIGTNVLRFKSLEASIFEHSMIKFFVLDILLRRVVAVSSDPAPDSAFAPSFFGRPSGQLP